jgi:hypothetical protein
MIWLSWRQFRAKGTVAVAGLAAIGVVLIITGPRLVNLYRQGLKVCRAAGNPASCINPAGSADPLFHAALLALLLLAPVLIGMFWGAPLVSRDLESGAYRLAWTQSASRSQWLAAKVLVGALATAATSGLLVLMIDWWSSPIQTVNGGRYTLGTFGIIGVTPIGYALFAFALGMASTLGVFIAVRAVVTYLVRPNLLPAKHLTELATQRSFGLGLSPSGVAIFPQPPNWPNAWIYSTKLIDKSGQSPSTSYLNHTCPKLLKLLSAPQPIPAGGHISIGKSAAHAAVPSGANEAFQSCSAALSSKFHEVVTYQPGSRYWPLQGLETALFVVLGVALLVVAFRWTRTRLS